MNIQPTEKKYIIKKSASLIEGGADDKIDYKIDYEKELNPAQLEAVKTINGAVLVIAGAGSGKTRTLVYRVARMIESGIKPENILLLTFTRKSSQEMLNRAGVILDSRCENVAGGTFHSFANMILRKYSKYLELKNTFTILDRSDGEDAINLIRGKITGKTEKRFPRKGTICSMYSAVINKNRSLGEIIEAEYPQFKDSVDEITRICTEYSAYKRQNSLLDYDDLLLYLKLLLESNETIRKKLSEQYKYIMIDEYQDTNSLQAEIVRLLSCTHNNVMAVGDDSQSIYSFRGANFKNIMNFPIIFDGAKIIKLEQNYRSTQKILDLTNEIISKAKEKYSKNLFTEITGGEKPAVVAAPDQSTEAEFISQRVLELVEEDISLNDISVLARSARSTYQLEIELGKKGIPFKKYGGYRFIETAHIKDVISYLRIVVNHEDQISWNRVLLLISGVGATTSQKLIPVLASTIGFDNLAITTEKPTLPLKGKGKEGIELLVNTIEKVKKSSLRPAEAAKAFIAYYYPILVSKYDDYTKREKDLEHFVYLAQGYNKLEDFLSDLTLEPPNSSVLDVEEGATHDEFLTLSTIHSAKGLEWNSVFVMGAVEGKFPSLYSYNSPDDLEEERRLMYVATTRAKENLYITYPIDMFDYALNMVLSKPSRFIEDVSEEILEKWTLEKE